MSLGEAVAQLLASPTAAVVYGVLLVAVLDALTGIAKAVSRGLFQWEWIDQWIRTKIAGRVAPIVLVLVFGELAPDIAIGDFSFDILTASGWAMAGVYAAAEVASILSNVNPGAPDAVPEGVRVPMTFAEHAFEVSGGVPEADPAVEVESSDGPGFNEPSDDETRSSSVSEGAVTEFAPDQKFIVNVEGQRIHRQQGLTEKCNTDDIKTRRVRWGSELNVSPEYKDFDVCEWCR